MHKCFAILFFLLSCGCVNLLTTSGLIEITTCLNSQSTTSELQTLVAGDFNTCLKLNQSPLHDHGPWFKVPRWLGILKLLQIKMSSRGGHVVVPSRKCLKHNI